MSRKTRTPKSSHFAIFIVASLSAFTAQSQIVGPSGQTSAFLCSRVPNGGPSLYWTKRKVVMRPGKIFDSRVRKADLVDAMRWAADQWNAASCSDFRFEIGADATQEWIGYDYLHPERNENIVSIRKKTGNNPNSIWYHEARQIAVTSISFLHGSGEILDADIELNGDQFVFTNCDLGERSCAVQYDLKNQLTHEFGHVLGLAHPTASFPNAEKTTMWPSSELGETLRRDLTLGDVDGVCFLYPIGKETSECYQVNRRAPADIVAVETQGCRSLGGSGGSFWLLCLLTVIAFFRTQRQYFPFSKRGE